MKHIVIKSEGLIDTPPIYSCVRCKQWSSINKGFEDEECEKVCIGAHCKCMNLDKKCPNFHYGDHECPYDSKVPKTNEREWEKEFIEAGAALEHERWANWQKYLHSKLYPLGNSELSMNNHLKVLPTELYTRWERQINTPYSELSEKEKESDRNEVRAYLPLLRQLEASTIARCAEKVEKMCHYQCPMDIQCERCTVLRDAATAITSLGK